MLPLQFSSIYPQQSGDTPLLSKNQIKTVKKLVFSVRKTLKIGRVNDAYFEACDVDLRSVLVWAIREQRLHCCDTEDLEFNVKLDGVLLVVSVSITHFNIGCSICLPNSICCSTFHKIVSFYGLIIICYEHFVIKLYFWYFVFKVKINWLQVWHPLTLPIKVLRVPCQSTLLPQRIVKRIGQ